MKLPAILITAVIGAAAAFPALAAPAGGVSTINITIGADLQDKADKYGVREFDYLKADLRKSIEQELTKTGDLVATGGTLDLVIEDATPNRPTMQQMSKTPGLSYESRGIGGAEISGVLTTADGASIPVSYRWYESDIANVRVSSTWSDAQTSFDRFARKLAKGDSLASK